MSKWHKLWFLIVVAIFMTFAVVLFFFYEAILSLEDVPRVEISPDNTYDETIRVVADFDYDPYSFIDESGKPAGYDIELFNFIANKMKKNVEIKLMNWNDAKKAILEGKADILMGLDYTPESLPEFELSMPFHNDQFIAFGKKRLVSISELYGLKIAALRGSISIPLFLKPYKLEDRVTLYNTYSEAFQSVANGENDYAIARYSVGRRAISKFQEDTIKDTGPILASSHLCFGAKKGNTEMINEINTVFIDLMKSGEIEKLGYKWLGHYVDVLNVREFLYAYRNYIAALLVALVLIFAATYIMISRHLVKIVKLQRDTLAKFLEYQKLISEATKGLYERVYEVDITHNTVGDESTQKYADSFGFANVSTCDDLFRVIAEKFVEKEFVQEYLSIFNRDNILKLYEEGTTSLKYDMMASFDGENYYWTRVTGRIFFWQFDKSVRLLIFRQNIDNEKKREIQLLDKSRRDSLTNLYNKVTTEELVNETIKYYKATNGKHAFFILDIDLFKNVNDNHGHKFGDQVIIEFAAVLKKKFRETDIIGRIGGDEFVVFINNIPDVGWAEECAAQLSASLNKEVTFESQKCLISASIGIAIYPEDGSDFASLYKNADSALYITKNNGRNGFTLFKNVSNSI